MKNSLALPVLYSVLRDTQQNAMVRHEAAEAIGAINDPSSVEILKEFEKDEERVVRETVVLALSFAGAFDFD